MTAEGRTTIPKLGGIVRENKDQILFVFYVIMISLQFAISLSGIAAPIYIRLGGLLILFISLIKNSRWFPFVITLFWGTSMMSPLPVLPTETLYILLFTGAVGAVNIRSLKLNMQPRILILVVYFLVMALLTIDPTIDYTSPLFLIIPIALIISTTVNDEGDVLRLMLALMLMSLFLASLFLLKRDDFAQAYKSFDIDRYGWTNSNMFGGSIAVGLVCAVGYYLNTFHFFKNRTVNIIAIATVFVSIPALILNASRGALLAAGATSILLLLFSKVKIPYKIVVTLVTVGFAVYLYNSGIFELLEARLGEQDFETGGNRLPIWEAKFNAFGQEGPLSWIFGVGQPRLRYLGVFYSTHNDFITSLIGYGAIGFVLFMYFLLLPFKLAKKCKLEILIMTALLFVEGMVLEPIFRGLLPFYMYYIILYKYATLSRSNS